MDSQGNKGNAESIRIGAKQCRRSWTNLEEEMLLSILEDLVVLGHKGKNGTFKRGIHQEVCKRMRQNIPRIVITEKQVVNKMKRWSSKLAEVLEMINTSGFGWDDTKKCVIVKSNQVLTQYLEKHPKVGNHVNKKFKKFKRLQAIFGKDCTTDHGLKAPLDAVEGMQPEIPNDEKDDNDMDFQPQSPASDMHSGVGVPAHPASLPSNAGSSREQSRAVKLVSAFNEIFDREMSAIAGKLPDPPKGGLVKEVQTLGFTWEEELDVLIKLANNPQYERLFWEFDDTSQKAAFLRRILG